jgi:hypothetical protein
LKSLRDLVVQEHVHAKHEIAKQRKQRHVQTDIGGKPGAGHDRQVAQRIDGMIEKIAVARPVYPAVTGEAAVERIAEPVDDDAERRQPEKRWMQAGRRIADEHQRGAGDANSGEPVGGDGARHMQAKPVEDIAFAAGENIFLNARNPWRPWRRLGLLNESDALHQPPPHYGLPLTVREHIQRTFTL